MSLLLKQSLRFVLVGLANTAAGLIAIYGAMLLFDAGPLAANAIGYGIGFCLGYALNRRWTFSDNRPAVESLLPYMALAALAYAMNLAAVLAASHYLGLGRYTAQLAGVAVYTCTMFIGSRKLVFRTATA